MIIILRNSQKSKTRIPIYIFKKIHRKRSNKYIYSQTEQPSERQSERDVWGKKNRKYKNSINRIYTFFLRSLVFNIIRNIHQQLEQASLWKWKLILPQIFSWICFEYDSRKTLYPKLSYIHLEAPLLLFFTKSFGIIGTSKIQEKVSYDSIFTAYCFFTIHKTYIYAFIKK